MQIGDFRIFVRNAGPWQWSAVDRGWVRATELCIMRDGALKATVIGAASDRRMKRPLRAKCR